MNTKPFIFKAKRKRRAIRSQMKNNKFVEIPQIVVQEAEMQPIQGIMPGSIEEFRFAIALMRLGYNFTFQFPIGTTRL